VEAEDIAGESILDGIGSIAIESLTYVVVLANSNRSEDNVVWWRVGGSSVGTVWP